MSDPFLGEIKYVGFNFAPQGYSTCQGQLVPVQQYAALYALLGTQYGGNGTTTFGLPNLSGRAALGQGQLPGGGTYQMGQTAGTETMTLNTANLPAHVHPATFTNGTFTNTGSSLTANAGKGTTATPAAGLQLSRGVDGDSDPNAVPFIYAPANTGAQVALGGVNVAGTVAGTVTVGATGSNSAFSIRDPYQVVNAIIAMVGIFPSRN